MSERARTYQDLLRKGSRQLARAGIETARLDAEVLLRHVSGLDRAGLFLRLPDPVPAPTEPAFDALVARRMGGEPVAYITGRREFMGLPFRVAPGVLIPRPETELLVEWALALLRTRPPATVVDVGTGSGAIAVSLAALGGPGVRVIATDVCPAALAIARDNAAVLLDAAQQSRIEFRQGSLLEPIDEPVDIVLANLPYLTPEQVDGNPDLTAEPRLALDGGSDGLDLVRDLIADLPRVMAPGGAAGLELDPSQTATVEELLRDLFPGRVVRTIRDLAGLPRHVVMEPDVESSRGGSGALCPRALPSPSGGHTIDKVGARQLRFAVDGGTAPTTCATLTYQYAIFRTGRSCAGHRSGRPDEQRHRRSGSGRWERAEQAPQPYAAIHGFAAAKRFLDSASLRSK